MRLRLAKVQGGGRGRGSGGAGGWMARSPLARRMFGQSTRPPRRVSAAKAKQTESGSVLGACQTFMACEAVGRHMLSLCRAKGFCSCCLSSGSFRGFCSLQWAPTACKRLLWQAVITVKESAEQAALLLFSGEEGNLYWAHFECLDVVHSWLDLVLSHGQAKVLMPLRKVFEM